MHVDSWIERWESDDIGFHENDVNARLVANFDWLCHSESPCRIFVPLCGKTVDIGWLLSKGCQVVAVELSEVAVQQLFGELHGEEPTTTSTGKLVCHSTKDLDVFVGDVFDLSREILGRVNAVYDRGALVALPEALRERYSNHLIEITDSAPQLLISCTYDQSMRRGSPYSVNDDEIHRNYGKAYRPLLVESSEIPFGIKGVEPAVANVWRLTRRC